MNGLDLYVVYRNPSDFPGQYVVRRQVAGPGVIFKDARPLAVGNLAAVRAALPTGLVRLERDPNDDPCIFEVWL